MKKLGILFLTIAMVAIFTAPSFAMLRKDLASVKGTVVSINAARTEITVRDMVTGKDVSFNSPVISPAIMTGNPVIVLYKKGTNTATTVRLVGGKKPAAMTSAPAPTTYQAPKTTTSATTIPAAPAAKSKYGW